MGAGGSLPNNSKTQEPPPLPPPFYTGNSHYGVSRLSGSHCDDRRSSRNSAVTSEDLGYQDPRSSDCLKNEEWWHGRPSAPSLSSLRPQQETLLTYAAQMTGWQSGSGTGVPSMHREAMELARTVSHLAAANQQLATAHTTLLAQLESLYLELNRERESKIRSNRDSSPRKKSTITNDRNNDEKIVSTPNDELKLRLGNSRITGQSKIVAQSTTRFVKKRNFETDENSRRNVVDKRCKSPRLDENRRVLNEDNETDLNFEYGKALERISVLENELKNSCGRNCNVEESTELRFGAKDRIGRGEEIENMAENDGEGCDDKEEIRGLMEEMERMVNERLEYRKINEKLTSDLESQKISIEKLRRDYEISRSQYEKVEYSLMERKKQLIELTKDFDIAKSETARLTRELQTFHVEKDTATARIADLEKDLLKSSLVNEQIGNIEIRESSRLRKKLSDEITSKNEQSKALDDALKEIRRLNEVIEAGEKNRQVGGSEEISEIEPTHEEEILEAEIATPRSSNMEDFRKELSLKREARQRAIAAVSSEMDRLRRELDAEKEAHSETSRVLDLLKSAQANDDVTKRVNVGNAIAENWRVNEEPVHDDWGAIMKPNLEENTNEADAQSLTDILKVSDELRSSIRLQTEKIDDLRYHLECEPEGHKNRIENLKIISQKSREASSNRERQINKLKNLLAQIIARLGDPRFRVEITDDARAEHDRQIEDIKRLKSLYDERLRVLVDLRDIAFKELTEVKDKLKSSRKENVVLEEDLRKAEEKIDNQDTDISNLESQLGLTKADCRDLQNQMSVINGLFTQMLLSASSADMDLDRLTRLLQENHDLISDMAREEGTEAAALPKLLLDLVEQVEGRGGSKSADGETERKDDAPKEENIAHNLPKVWRVLLELLSCHAVESPAVVPASLSTDPNSCYKSVDTPSGPRLVISVSKTYIRLKELILEKKHLEKEMNRMKQLNTHLESKLGEQEKRLSTVSSELSKTWNVVGRMQAQHQQLHTHEKILRYELQQKRKMLQELKQELEYCREKWESARQKNTNTEIEWRSLRREFAARKSLAAQDSFNNSGESGFSDERGDDSDEEDEAVEESRIRIGPRRRARKENARAPTPDTESEQPTDTEVSETKTGSTSTPEQRTPTPETALPICEVSFPSTSSNSTDESHPEHGQRRSKPINPLDQALANVIQNLITNDDSNACQPVVKTVETINENIADFSATSSILPESEEVTISPESTENCGIEEISKIEETEKRIESFESEATEDRECSEVIEEIVSAISVFSIGPFPTSSTSSPAKTVQFSDPLIVGPSTQPSTPPPVTDNIAETISSTQTLSNPETISVNETQSIVKEEESKSSSNVLKSCEESSETAKKSVEIVNSSEETELPSTSNAEGATRSPRTHEEVLAARAARLRRLEEQADWLMKKMSATSRRGSALSTRLEELHEAYGEPPAPPPMPDVLPNVRLPSDTDTLQEKEKIVHEVTNETPPPDVP